MTSSRIQTAAVLAVLVALAPCPASAQQLTLDQALEAAFSSHPSLRAAQARVEGARHDTDLAGAARFPTIALSYGVTRFEEPMVTTPIHAFDPATFPGFDRTLAQGSVGLRYTILDWGARGSGISGAEAALAAENAAARVSTMDLIERVTVAWLTVGSARAVDAAAQAQVSALTAELARVERNLEAGSAAEVEVLRASTALQDARAQRTSSAGAVGLAERNLARLTGLSSGVVSAAVVAEPTVPLPWSPEPETEGRSPVLDRAERRAEAARARVSAERATRLPRLEVTGALADYGTLDSSHTFEWQAGLQLSWTLFAGGRRRATIRSADASLRAAQNEVTTLALELSAAIDAARTAVESADARRAVLEASVDQWRELARIEALRIEAGIGLQRDVLEAQSGLFQAEAGLVGARAESLIARVRFARASGTLSRAWVADLLRGTP